MTFLGIRLKKIITILLTLSSSILFAGCDGRFLILGLHAVAYPFVKISDGIEYIETKLDENTALKGKPNSVVKSELYTPYDGYPHSIMVESYYDKKGYLVKELGYHSNGVLGLEGEYNRGFLVQEKYYDIAGTLRSEEFGDGKKNRKIYIKVYDRSGAPKESIILEKELFKADKEYKKFKELSERIQTQESIAYRLRNGEYIIYSSNGKIYAKFNKKNGQYFGEQKQYYWNSDNILEIKEYKDGEAISIEEFFPNGNKKSSWKKGESRKYFFDNN